MPQTQTTATTNTLLPVTCQDVKAEIRLKNYADMIVRNKNNQIVAIRFGGYPEMVRGMADCICAGCTLTVDAGKTDIVMRSDKPNGYYRKVSHDGLYAESILYLKDDDPKSLSVTGDDGKKTTVNAKRNLYIFCEDDSMDSIFRELDRKLSVPLIPEFRDYFLSELVNRKILNKLKVWLIAGSFTAYHLEVTEDETEIVQILEDGLRLGAIKIPGAVPGIEGEFSEISGFTQYLHTFASKIANRIKSSFTPLFDPETDELSDSLKDADSHIAENAGYHLYPAQLACSEALKRILYKDNIAMIVAECGSGKTKIGTAAMYALQGLQSHQNKKSFNAVICPSHLCKKWVREIEESAPDSVVSIMRHTSDVDKAYDIYKTGDKTVYCIISKEKARDGYMKRPAVYWSNVKRGYLCPDCGKVVEMDVFDDGTKYRVTADQFFFMKETGANHKCEHCGGVLWGALNPDVVSPKKTEWVKIGDYGFVHRKFAKNHLLKTKNQKAIAVIEKLVTNPNEIMLTKGAVRRYSISSYFKKKIKHIDGLIIDELHQYSGDSGQGAAMAELAGISKNVIGMTATLINGYAKGLFYLLFRLKSNLMLMDKKEYRDSRTFCEEYGVTEKIYEIQQDLYNANSRNKKAKKRERFLPGVSPLVYSRFLMNNTVFLSLNDMGAVLPEYEEIPMPLDMTEEIEQEYERIENALKKVMRDDKKIGNKILSKYLNLLSAYPDQPYGHEPIIHPFSEEEYPDNVIVAPANLTDIDTLLPKDEKVLALVERKIAAGERVIIYTAWTRLDTQQKLLKLFSSKGYKTKILERTVKPEDREEWVNKQVEKGCQILITNPALVETGLDLNDFTTLIFYNIAYNLYIFRQASRRSWRINQKAPRVEVYMFYYSGTMQYRAIKLMASKLAAATVIESNISDEGLAAMSDCQDMTTQLARELTIGIKDEVDDLAESFKKMAILKPICTEQGTEETTQAAEKISAVTVPITQVQSKPEPQSVNEFITLGIGAKPKRKQAECESQMSLFDLLAS